MVPLRVVYDLSQCPVAYDFIIFLVASEMVRERYGADYIDLSVLPGPAGGFRPDYHTHGRKVGQLWNILIPSVQLMPTVMGFHLGGCGQYDWPLEDGKPIRQYGLKIGVEVAKSRPRPRLRAPQWAHDYLDRVWPENAVSVTVRSAPWQEDRNIVVPGDVYEVIRDHGCEPVVIPDTYHPDMEVPAGVCREAAVNICLRMAAYERSRLNLFTTNGPIGLAMYSEVPFLWFLEHDVGDIKTTSTKFYTKCGFPPGTQWPGSVPGQHVHYGKFDAEVVNRCLQDASRASVNATSAGRVCTG